MSPRLNRSSSQSLVSTALIPASRSWSRNASAVWRSSKSRTTAQPSYAGSPTWMSAPPRLLLRRNTWVDAGFALRLLALVELLLQVLGLLGAVRGLLRALDDLCLQLLCCRFVVSHDVGVQRLVSSSLVGAGPGKGSSACVRSPSSANAR